MKGRVFTQNGMHGWCGLPTMCIFSCAAEGWVLPLVGGKSVVTSLNLGEKVQVVSDLGGHRMQTSQNGEIGLQ